MDIHIISLLMHQEEYWTTPDLKESDIISTQFMARITTTSQERMPINASNSAWQDHSTTVTVHGTTIRLEVS